MSFTNFLGKWGMKNAFAGGTRGYAGMGAILGRDVLTGMKEGYSAATRRSVYGGIGGAAAGAALGGADENGSVLGGALGGAGIGIATGRYVMGGKGSRFSLSGIGRQLKNDYNGAKLSANQGFNKIKGLYNNYI